MPDDLDNPKTQLKWEFYKDTAQGIRWRAKHVSNGNVMFHSSEGYTDIRDAKHCAKLAGWVEGESLTEEV